MNVFELEAGNIRRYIPAESEEHARQIGTDPEQHPDLHFRSFAVRKVEIEGYEVVVKPIEETTPFDGWDKPKLREWLDEKGIQYTPQWGEAKLRELALQHAS